MRGILFDFDGTIAETEQDGHRIAYNEAFHDLGLDWHWDNALYSKLLFVAGGKERIAHYIERYGAPVPAGAPVDLVAQVHSAKVKRFSALGGRLPLRPGVQRLVQEAKSAGIKIAVATTASLQGVRTVIGQDPALLSAFDVFAAGDVVAKKKPFPDVYLWALHEMGFRASECIAIEDSSVGLAASLAAGIPTIITTNDDTRAQAFDGARAVLTDLGDLQRPATTLLGPEPPAGIVNVAYLSALLSG